MILHLPDCFGTANARHAINCIFPIAYSIASSGPGNSFPLILAEPNPRMTPVMTPNDHPTPPGQAEPAASRPRAGVKILRSRLQHPGRARLLAPPHRDSAGFRRLLAPPTAITLPLPHATASPATTPASCALRHAACSTPAEYNTRATEYAICSVLDPDQALHQGTPSMHATHARRQCTSARHASNDASKPRVERPSREAFHGCAWGLRHPPPRTASGAAPPRTASGAYEVGLGRVRLRHHPGGEPKRRSRHEEPTLEPPASTRRGAAAEYSV